MQNVQVFIYLFQKNNHYRYIDLAFIIYIDHIGIWIKYKTSYCQAVCYVRLSNKSDPAQFTETQFC